MWVGLPPPNEGEVEMAGNSRASRVGGIGGAMTHSNYGTDQPSCPARRQAMILAGNAGWTRGRARVLSGHSHKVITAKSLKFGG